MNIEIKNGVVTKDGDEIGVIQDSTCYLTAQVGPTVKGAIKKTAGVELSFVVGNAPDAPDAPEEEDSDSKDVDAPKPSLADMSDDELAEEMKRRSLIQEAPQVPETPVVVQPPVIERDLSAVERLHKLANEGKIPQPPAKHPAMGDKTPEYVAWFKAHATPEEIAVRYPDNRRIPASVREFQAAEEKLKGKLPGEKKDTAPENDFIGKGGDE
jgi:hypothetical protein